MTESLIFRVITLCLLLLFVANRAYYTRKFPVQENETVTKMSTGPMTVLTSLLSLVALGGSVFYIFFPSLIDWASAPFPFWLRWLGVLIAISGFGLLEWSQRALAGNWSDQPRLKKEQTLVQSGPYQWMRHPIYTAFLLILGSTLLITANWLVGLAWLSSVGLEAVSRIQYEETIMQERFGSDYELYRERTGKLLPKFGR